MLNNFKYNVGSGGKEIMQAVQSNIHRIIFSAAFVIVLGIAGYICGCERTRSVAARESATNIEQWNRIWDDLRAPMLADACTNGLDVLSDRRTMAVKVSAGGSISLARTLMDTNTLRGIAAKTVAASGSSTPVLIVADRDTKFAAVFPVMATCARAGIWKQYLPAGTAWEDRKISIIKVHVPGRDYAQGTVISPILIKGFGGNIPPPGLAAVEVLPDKLVLNRKTVSSEELGEYLKKEYAGKADKALIVMPASDVGHQQLMTALEIMVKAGAKAISIMEKLEVVEKEGDGATDVAAAGATEK